MGIPALASPVVADAVLVLDLDALLARLPATARAALTWTKPRIEQALQRLVSKPVEEGELDAVASDLWEPVRALGRAVTELLTANPDRLRTALMDDLRRQQDRLDAFLPDDDSRDTLQWVLGFLRSVYGLVFASVRTDDLVTFEDVGADEPEVRAFMKAQVALMAAANGAKTGANPDYCAELIDAAYLNLMEFRNAVRRQGLWLSASPNETSEEHRDNVKRYAARLRETFTAEDWKTLDSARMRNLR